MFVISPCKILPASAASGPLAWFHCSWPGRTNGESEEPGSAAWPESSSKERSQCLDNREHGDFWVQRSDASKQPCKWPQCLALAVRPLDRSTRNRDDGSSLDFNATSTIRLCNHLVNILAVDPNASLCGGHDDPCDSNCVAWQRTYFGSSSGSSFPDTMQ